MLKSIIEQEQSLLDVLRDYSDQLDIIRLSISHRIEKSKKAQYGQYFTPNSIANLMAGMFQVLPNHIRLLDPGAGVGSLLGAFVCEIAKRELRPASLHITACEIDPLLEESLKRTMNLCQEIANRAGVTFTYDLITADFFAYTLEHLSTGLFSASQKERFNCAIINPPYMKIQSSSTYRKLLRTIGIETSNLYTGFVAAAIKLLQPEGELVAITPRSFCNGRYFREFRKFLLDQTTLQHLHLFDSRTEAFNDDAVLQENIIIHIKKETPKQTEIVVTTSNDLIENTILFEVPYEQIVHPHDSEQFIHIVSQGLDEKFKEAISLFKTTLDELSVSVSTGRVVDFRATSLLRAMPDENTVPLLYPLHLDPWQINWPKQGKKANAILNNSVSRKLLVPNGNYVLTKRFTSKEEPRRIVASIYATDHTYPYVGFENHLNYFHCNGEGLELQLATGLAAFLNSTIVDSYFRQFSGHTQVNATDLRNLPYPSTEQLQSLGRVIGDKVPTQGELDEIITQELLVVNKIQHSDPTRNRVEEALVVLRELGLPKGQLNDRSAWTLLALLNLTSDMDWSEASNPRKGVTQLMDFLKNHYSVQYAPNTRETVRRQTIHQFLAAGLILINPDKADRAPNSPKTVYQIEEHALDLLRVYGTGQWEMKLTEYLAIVPTLAQRFAQERDMIRIPIRVAPGKTITLSPGGQNVLVEKIIHEFAPRFTPDGELLYVGDTDEKFSYFLPEALQDLGIKIEAHGKMPDVVIHFTEKNWLILIEAVTSHGPVDAKRREELQRLFSQSSAGLVFVTAFLSRRDMVKYLSTISWETEVWVADAPSHLIHFNGERFLGPYETESI